MPDQSDCTFPRFKNKVSQSVIGQALQKAFAYFNIKPMKEQT